ncbi:MAG: hypothetical protein JRI23_22260, partial [Deltaproteobacteria bacterium]|nr:hypothetical protein [Deltaproteobacteria bacterium]MBW2534670.1 hypothetical protein [Deltaproteobacteria bacterium]
MRALVATAVLCGTLGCSHVLGIEHFTDAPADAGVGGSGAGTGGAGGS